MLANLKPNNNQNLFSISEKTMYNCFICKTQQESLRKRERERTRHYISSISNVSNKILPCQCYQHLYWGKQPKTTMETD